VVKRRAGPASPHRGWRGEDRRKHYAYRHDEDAAGRCGMSACSARALGRGALGRHTAPQRLMTDPKLRHGDLPRFSGRNDGAPPPAPTGPIATCRRTVAMAGELSSDAAADPLCVVADDTEDGPG